MSCVLLKSQASNNLTAITIDIMKKQKCKSKNVKTKKKGGKWLTPHYARIKEQTLYAPVAMNPSLPLANQSTKIPANKNRLFK